MSNGFENFQNASNESVDVAMKSADAVSKGLQAIAAEATDYSKRALDAGASAFEKLTTAQSIETAVAVQSDFVRSAYEGYVGQMARFGEIAAEMAKASAKPYEALYGKYGK